MNETTDLFSVMTFNVGLQDRLGGAERKRLVEEVLRKHPVDIIGFQEFAINKFDVVERARTNMKLILGEPAGDIYINTIAYNGDRFDVLQTATIWLSPDGKYGRAWEGAERGATWALFKDRTTSNQVLMMNVHLDNKSALARAEGLKVILSFIGSKFSDVPVIFVGDSNTSIASHHPSWKEEKLKEPYDMMLRAGFKDCWVETHAEVPRPRTFHGFQGPHFQGDEWGTYDTEWIFIRGLCIESCELIEDQVEDKWPSDHFPMKAILGFYTSSK